MFISNPTTARAAWYDRNPISEFDNYQATLSPHATTKRYSYTVPSGKKFNLETFLCDATRVTAASTVGTCGCSGGVVNTAATNFTVIEIQYQDNTVIHVASVYTSTTIMLQAGEGYASYTFDDSTGGSIQYQMTTKGTEFDA